jgi:hypothetical protein
MVPPETYRWPDPTGHSDGDDIEKIGRLGPLQSILTAPVRDPGRAAVGGGHGLGGDEPTRSERDQFTTGPPLRVTVKDGPLASARMIRPLSLRSSRCVMRRLTASVQHMRYATPLATSAPNRQINKSPNQQISKSTNLQIRKSPNPQISKSPNLQISRFRRRSRMKPPQFTVVRSTPFD